MSHITYSFINKLSFYFGNLVTVKKIFVHIPIQNKGKRLLAVCGRDERIHERLSKPSLVCWLLTRYIVTSSRLTATDHSIWSDAAKVSIPNCSKFVFTIMQFGMSSDCDNVLFRLLNNTCTLNVFYKQWMCHTFVLTTNLFACVNVKEKLN